MSVQTAAIPVAYASREIPATASSSRLGMLDFSRLIAAAGIVWVHVTATETAENLYPKLYPLGTFGVPFYLFIAILFMARSVTRDPSMPLSRYFFSRLLRVYVPFMFWTIVYTGLTELKSYAHEHRLCTIPLSVFYAGGHMHLWFLSYLLIISMIGAALVRGLSDKDGVRRIVAIAFLLAGIGCCFWAEPAWITNRPHEIGDMEFWKFAFRALPTTFWALALALTFGMKGKLPRTDAGVAIGGLMLWVWALLSMEVFDSIKVLRAAAGLGLALFALWPVRSSIIEKLGAYGKYSYGVYLSHVMFVRIFILWMQRYNVQPSLAFILVEFVVVFGCSLGLSILLSQSKYTRWVLGE